MNKGGFKIGDKVKLSNPKAWSMGNAAGIVIEFTPPFIRVDWEGRSFWSKNYPHFAREIEHAVGVGEQLVFSFMLP